MPSSWTSANEEEEPKAIFVRPCGKAFKFFLHSSLTQGHRAQMKTLIKDQGGRIVNDHHRCNVVVVSKAGLHCSLRIFELSYDVNENARLRNVHVETTHSIVSYINSGRFILGGRRLAKSGMPGPRPSGGRRNRRPYRVEFTVDDDDALARYLATRIPHKASGGRSGEVIYKELEQLGQSGLPEFIWANRHTWQSWRNRYQQQMEYIDEVIYRYVKRWNNPSPKSTYHRVRRPPEENEEDYDLDSAMVASEGRLVRYVPQASRSRRESPVSPMPMHNLPGIDMLEPWFDNGEINMHPQQPEGLFGSFSKQKNEPQVAVSVKEEPDDLDDLDKLMMLAKSSFPPQTPQPSTPRYTPFLSNSPVVMLGDHMLEVDGVFPLPGTRAHAWLMKRAHEASEAERVLLAPWN